MGMSPRERREHLLIGPLEVLPQAADPEVCRVQEEGRTRRRWHRLRALTTGTKTALSGPLPLRSADSLSVAWARVAVCVELPGATAITDRQCNVAGRADCG
jgi:hypothetical protein